MWEECGDDVIFGYIEFGILAVYANEDVQYMIQKGKREICITDK